jgi:hypothetical protein
VSLKFAQNQKGIVVGLYDIIGLFEPYSDAFDLAAFGNRRRIIDGHGRVFARPGKEGVRLSAVHVLARVEDDDIVERLHLERDPPGVVGPGASEDKLELDVARGLARPRVDGHGMTPVRLADEMTALIRGIDREDADKDVNGGEGVGQVVGERALILAVRAPGDRLLVGIEDVDKKCGNRGGKRGKEDEGEEKTEGLGGSAGMAEEAVDAKGREAAVAPAPGKRDRDGAGRRRSRRRR